MMFGQHRAAKLLLKIENVTCVYTARAGYMLCGKLQLLDISINVFAKA